MAKINIGCEAHCLAKENQILKLKLEESSEKLKRQQLLIEELQKVIGSQFAEILRLKKECCSDDQNPLISTVLFMKPSINTSFSTQANDEPDEFCQRSQSLTISPMKSMPIIPRVSMDSSEGTRPKRNFKLKVTENSLDFDIERKRVKGVITEKILKRVDKLVVSDNFSFEYMELFDDINEILHQKLKMKSTKAEMIAEDFIFSRIQKSLFFTLGDELYSRDLQIYEKISVLHSHISPQMLDIPENLLKSSFFSIMQKEICKVNQVYGPKNKARLFLLCFENISNFIESCNGKSPSSDELFPFVTYLLLISNPPKLFLQIEFIQKYLGGSNFKGEFGFVLATIQASILFLNSLDGNYLNSGILRVSDKSRKYY